jgi:hypothetical protein
MTCLLSKTEKKSLSDEPAQLVGCEKRVDNSSSPQCELLDTTCKGA